MTRSEPQDKHVQNILRGNIAQLLALWEHSADAMSLSDSEGTVLAAVSYTHLTLPTICSV